MEAVIFDIEGVLIDVSERLKAALEETCNKFGISVDDPSKLKGEARKYFWDCFMSTKYVHLDKPIQCNIDLALELQKKYKLILITGARCDVAKIHEKRLREFGLKFDLYCRPRNSKLPAHIFKRIIIEKFIKNKYQIAIIFDDNENVCRALSKYANRVYFVRGCERKLIKYEK